MSRHSFKTTYNSRKVDVVVGFDRPLQYFFMTVMYTESFGKNNHSDQDDDHAAIVYSNLANPEAGNAATLTYFRRKLASLGIKAPESLFREAESDADNQIGNRLTRHHDDGRVEEIGTTPHAVEGEKDSAQLLIEDINATGGLVSLPSGLLAPAAGCDWIDLADAYLQACAEKGTEPVIQDETDSEASQSPFDISGGDIPWI